MLNLHICLINYLFSYAHIHIYLEGVTFYELRWDDLRLLLAVYDQGNLSGAARLLGLAQPTRSQRMSEREMTVSVAGGVHFRRCPEANRLGFVPLDFAQHFLLLPRNRLSPFLG